MSTLLGFRLALIFVFCLFNYYDCEAQRLRGKKAALPFENIAMAKEYVENQTKKKLFSGTVLVAKEGAIIWKAAYGWANQEKKIKNNIATKINIGSINKAFTAVCVMQLIEEGKLTLEDKLIQYIPELKMEGAGEITIRHLLQMKSGLGSYFDNEYFQNNYQQLRNMEDYLPALVDLELYFEPGSSRRYSNAGYELLGILVQRISGKNYYDFVRENVYNKAKMLHTDAYERDQLTDNLALGYSQYKESDFLGSELPVSQKGKFEQDVNQRHAVKGTAAGGGYTTAEDLYHFVLALQQNKLLDKKHTDLIFNRFEEKEARYPSYRKGGGSVGINAMINADFEKNYVIIVLSNFDPPTASDLASRLAKTIELGTF